MSKTIFTKRAELICGKLDLMADTVVSLRDAGLLALLDAIRYDAERMEQKLVSRKQEVTELERDLKESLDCNNELLKIIKELRGLK